MTTTTHERPRPRERLWRGLTRRCPKCGAGPLYDGWSSLREHCPVCGLRYLENPGDPWFWLLFVDRAAFVFPVIAALFFGLHRASIVAFVAFCILLVAAFVLTTPNRYGVCVAIDYLTRERWGDERDEADRSDPR